MHVIKIDEQQNKLSDWKRYDFIVNEIWEGEHDLTRYPLLRGIDPNQDAYFNEVQIPLVVQELEMLKVEAKFQESSELIPELVDFMNTVGTHELVRFVAD